MGDQSERTTHQLGRLAVSIEKVLIAGGGIGGLTAALALAKEGIQVELFEQAEELGEVGAGIQLSPNCTRVLHHLGLEEALKQRAFLPVGVELRSWASGNTLRASPLGDSVVESFGFPYYHMHRADLMSVLADAVSSNPDIKLNLGNRLTGFTQSESHVVANTPSGEVSGDCLVGADGIHSVVRAELWGDDSPRFTGCVAWRALVETSKLPPDLIRPMSSAWLGPGKHFVHYYVRRGELVNCVCVVEKDGWEVESWTERGDKAELVSDFAGWGDEIQHLINNVDPDNLYRWALHDRDPMPQWGKGRVSLLGDACHPTLPFMAQGAAMAIEDAGVLATCLTDAQTVESGLSDYEDLRRERTASIQMGSRGNSTMFHLPDGDAADQRNQMLAAVTEDFPISLYEYDALSLG